MPPTHTLDKPTQKRLIEAGKVTLVWTVVARLTGRHRDWRRRALAGEEPLASTFQKIYDHHLAVARKAAKKIEEFSSWQQAAWHLERNMPDGFGLVPALRQEEAEGSGSTSARARMEVLEQAFVRTSPDTDADGGGDAED